MPLIRCPDCKRSRSSGGACPNCGHKKVYRRSWREFGIFVGCVAVAIELLFMLFTWDAPGPHLMILFYLLKSLASPRWVYLAILYTVIDLILAWFLYSKLLKRREEEWGLFGNHVLVDPPKYFPHPGRVREPIKDWFVFYGWATRGPSISAAVDRNGEEIPEDWDQAEKFEDDCWLEVDWSEEEIPELGVGLWWNKPKFYKLRPLPLEEK